MAWTLASKTSKTWFRPTELATWDKCLSKMSSTLWRQYLWHLLRHHSHSLINWCLSNNNFRQRQIEQLLSKFMSRSNEDSKNKNLMKYLYIWIVNINLAVSNRVLHLRLKILEWMLRTSMEIALFKRLTSKLKIVACLAQNNCNKDSLIKVQD